MIIGVDAGALCIRDNRLRVGVFYITREFLRYVQEVDEQNRYRIYTFSEIPSDVRDLLSREIEIVKLQPSLGYQVVRTPIELLFRPVSVYLGLSQSIPFHFGKSIGFIYDLGFFHHPSMYPDSLERLKTQTANIVKYARHIITISKASKADIIAEYNVRPDKISVCYLGAPTEWSDVGDKLIHSRSYLLFVGSLKRQKNIPFLLRGFARFIKQTNKDIDLLIIGGDYWRDPGIEKEIKRLHIEARVKFIGQVPYEQLPVYYRGAVAFVSPSLGEGFCMPAVESLACGVPVIGSNTGPFPEVVGQAGILVSPYQEDELVSAMRIITGAARESYQRYCKRQAAKFTWKGFARGVYEAIQQA